MSGVLFFDGACGMCTRARNFLVRLDRTGDLQTEPFQRAGAAERLGIPASRLVESVWWLDSSGDVSGGAEAVNAALSRGASGPDCRCSSTASPVFGYAQEAVYRWVAAHRYRFPGTTPYCESHPAGC